MKNIVFVIESLRCGGAEKSLVTLLQKLDYKKYNVDLILTFDRGDFYKLIPKEVNTFFLDLFEDLPFYEKFLKRSLLYYRKKINFNKKYHPSQLYWKTYNKPITFHKHYDVAIAYNQGFATYYVANNIFSKKKYSWLNTDYKKAGYNIDFDIISYTHFNKVICVSEENEAVFRKELIKTNKNIDTLVIKDITDDLLIKKLSKESNGLENIENSIKLLTVGRLAEAKGYNLAIEACRLLIDKGKDVIWYVIGEGPKRKELELLIVKHNLQHNFKLLGLKENPYPFIKSCDIYVQTSLFEGLGLSIIEAAILNKPIVSTNFPAIFSIIENEKTGLICDMNPNAIATTIERYLIDTELKRRVVKNLSLLTNNDKEVTLKKVNELLDA